MTEHDITSEAISKFVGGQLERTPSFGPLRRGEIGRLSVENSILEVIFSWALVSEGEVLTFKGWKPEVNPEPVIIPLMFGHIYQLMDEGRILMITEMFRGIPIRNLFMAPGCGTMERPKKKGERR